MRINDGEFEKTLQGDTGTATGRLDTRFSGPEVKSAQQGGAEYDPQSTAIGSAYVSPFNDYVRKELKCARQDF